jgi:iron complex transport system substrate-binding protein
MRIVSLLPSATEIVSELGLADQLLGVTFECRWPAGIEQGRREVVTGLNTHGLDPAAIDALVRETLEKQGNLYTLQLDEFRSCDPELVLTQDLCRVCALPSGDVNEAMDHLGCSANVVTLDPHTLNDVMTTILDVGAAAGVPERAEAYVAQRLARLESLGERTAALPHRRVFVLEWLDPPFLSGHWVPDVVIAAGGEPVLSLPGERSVATDWETIVATEADVIIVAPCGFDLPGAVTQAHEVAKRIPDGPNSPEIWAMDADGYLVRPGPRLVEGAEQIAALLHGITTPDPTIVARIR